MNLKNRVLSGFLAVVACSSFLNIAAFAAGEPTIKLNGSTNVFNPGDEITLTFDVENNPGIVSMFAEVSWDDAVVLTSVTDTKIFAGSSLSKTYTSPYVLNWSDDTAEDNLTTTGTFGKLVFKVADDATAGSTHTIKLTSDIENTLDFNMEGVGFTANSFEYQIASATVDPTITVTPSPVTLKFGEKETETLTAATTDFDGTVEWTITEGADVISIDGKNTTCDVKALKAGKAKIKATAGTAETTVEVNVAKLNPDETIIVPDVGTVKFLNFAVVGADDSSKHINITKGEETRSSAKTIGEILNGEWSGTVNANIAIGVITADAADAFTFEIK